MSQNFNSSCKSNSLNLDQQQYDILYKYLESATGVQQRNSFDCGVCCLMSYNSTYFINCIWNG